MLTQARADILTGFLEADQDRAEKLASLEPEAAVVQINKSGYDFTVDEVKEYGKVLKASQGDKLDAEALESVAGGLSVATSIAIAYGCVIAIATKLTW